MEWKSTVLVCSFLVLILGSSCFGAEPTSNLPDFLTKIREKRQFSGANAAASANSFGSGFGGPYGFGGGGSFAQASANANNFGSFGRYK